MLYSVAYAFSHLKATLETLYVLPKSTPSVTPLSYDVAAYLEPKFPSKASSGW